MEHDSTGNELKVSMQLFMSIMNRIHLTYQLTVRLSTKPQATCYVKVHAFFLSNMACPEIACYSRIVSSVTMSNASESDCFSEGCEPLLHCQI